MLAPNFKEAVYIYQSRKKENGPRLQPVYVGMTILSNGSERYKFKVSAF